MKNKLLIILFVFVSSYANAINLFGGIEIGSKGVKISVIDIQNVNKGIYDVKEFWTENTGIAKGISITGNLYPEDIEKTSKVVLANYLILINEFNIDSKKIYIVASSGVAQAKNSADLIAKINELTSKNADILTSQLEAKLACKGCIPPKYYLNSIYLDIGAGNTKGGYVEVKNEDNFVFFPLNMGLGTVTLTEKINKKTWNDNLKEYINMTIYSRNDLDTDVKKMYDARPLAYDMKNIYMSGGAIWAFYTIFNEGTAKNNFNQFTLDDVLIQNEILMYNFEKYVQLAKQDSEVDKVLKTYSQKNLIAANSILISTLNNIKDVDSKKIYFVKQGQMAWLLSYIAESAKGAKVIY